MELAAMASAAVPGLTPTGVAGSPDDAADFDAALLVDDAGRRWRVRAPKHLEASMRLETELLVLRTFVPAVRAELPFVLPYVAGTVRQGELCTFVYSHLPGATRSIDALMTSGRSVAEEIGRAMAAIHGLPRELVTRADLPSYSANEFRQRRLNELDQAATTGLIPSVLLRRWEHALEDVSLWRFKPTVVHGDLHEDNILLTGERVSAITGWTDLRVGDPADDFAWLIAANDQRFTDTVHSAYLSASSDPEDPHLIRRAALSAEFALAQWLVRGVAAENSTMVDEAVEMLGTLEADVLAQEAADKRTGQARQAAAAARAAKVVVTPIEPAAAPASGTNGSPAVSSGTAASGAAAPSGAAVPSGDAVPSGNTPAAAADTPADTETPGPAASDAPGNAAGDDPEVPDDLNGRNDDGDSNDGGGSDGDAAKGADAAGDADPVLAEVIVLPARTSVAAPGRDAEAAPEEDTADTTDSAGTTDSADSSGAEDPTDIKDTGAEDKTPAADGGAADRDGDAKSASPDSGTTATTSLPLVPVRDN